MYNPFNYNNCITIQAPLIKSLGLECAAYLSELLNYCNGNSINPDRKSIAEKIQIEEKLQLQFDSQLQEINIISNNNGTISVNIETIMSILQPDSKVNITKIKKITSLTKEEKKMHVIKSRLKSKVLATNPELRDAYNLWIDSVMEKQGWMSDASVIDGQTTVDDFSNHDLDVALDILKIASINGYRDIRWAINRYKESKPIVHQNYQISNQPIVLSEEVF